MITIIKGDKMVKVSDLKDQIGTSGIRPILHCKVCGTNFSADVGDYWLVPKDHIFTCCGVPMILATKRTVYNEVGL